MCQTKPRASRRNLKSFGFIVISVLQFTITDYDKSSKFCPNFANCKRKTFSCLYKIALGECNLNTW